MDGDAKNISLSDLSELNRLSCRIEEMKLYDLSEYAMSLADDFLAYSEDFDVLTSFALLRENADLSFHVSPDEALPENRRILSEKQSLLSAFDRLSLSDAFLSALKAKNRFLTESDFFPTEREDPVIAYVKNPLSDEAFDVFSEEFGEYSAIEAPSLKEAVRMLESGECGYCLLPLEEGDGHRIFAVEDLIREYELKIVAVTPVYGYDGNANMRYALLSDTLSILPYSKEDDRYLEVHLPEKTVLGAFGSIASCLEYSVPKMQSAQRNGQRFYSAVLKSEGQSFLPILVFFSLFCSDATFVGLYKNLET